MAASFKLVLAMNFHIANHHGQHLFMDVNSRYPVRHKVSSWRERRACCEFLNQGHRLSPLPPKGTDNAQLFAQPRTLRIRHADSQSSTIPARLFQRHQSEIARHLLAAAKAFSVPDDQHEGQGGEGTDSGMGHQTLRLWTFFRFLFDSLVQLCDRRIQSIQQLEQLASSPAGPWRQLEGLQFLPSTLPPQPLLTVKAFIQRHRLQLIHDPRPRLYHAVPVPQQLPQITVLPTGYPNPRKIILQQQFENVPCVLAIGLLLASSFRSDHLGIPPPQLYSQPFQQLLKPAPVTAGLYSHPYGLTRRRQGTIELLCPLGMCKMLLFVLSGVGIHRSNFLKLGVKI